MWLYLSWKNAICINFWTGAVVRYYGNWKWCFYIFCRKPIQFGHLVGNNIYFQRYWLLFQLEGNQKVISTVSLFIKQPSYNLKNIIWQSSKFLIQSLIYTTKTDVEWINTITKRRVFWLLVCKNVNVSASSAYRCRYVLGDKDSSDDLLHAGSHFFPFEFALPLKLPSSFTVLAHPCPDLPNKPICSRTSQTDNRQTRMQKECQLTSLSPCKLKCNQKQVLQ